MNPRTAKLLFSFITAMFLGVFALNSPASSEDTSWQYGSGYMQSTGNPKVLVVYLVNDNDPAPELTPEDIRNLFFSETMKYNTDSSVSLNGAAGDSLRAFYYRSTYGKVDIDGTVIEYHVSDDLDDSGTAEVLTNLANQIDLDAYDTNNDGYIDGVYFVCANFDHNSYVADHEVILGNKTVKYPCFLGQSALAGDQYHLGTICHETCHLFGPPDIYENVSLNPDGSCAETIMDVANRGDLPGIMKYFMGWLDHVQFISRFGDTTIELKSISDHGEMAVVYCNGDPGSRFWYTIEYLTDSSNNVSEGVRIMRTEISPDLTPGSSPYEYLEALHTDSSYYYLHAGDEVGPYSYPATSYGTEYVLDNGAKYYKENLFSGITVHVNSISDGKANITVSIEEQPAQGNTCKADIRLINDEGFADCVLSSDKLLIGTATLSVPMQVQSGTAWLESSESNESIPLIIEISPSDTNTAALFVGAEDIKKLVCHSVYTIHLNNALKTYFGAQVELDRNEIIFSSLPASLVSGDLFSYNLGPVRTKDFFKVDDYVSAIVVGFDSRCRLIKYDVANGTYQDILLFDNAVWNTKAILLDHCYIVFQENDEHTLLTISAIDLNGNSLDELQLTCNTSCSYCGLNGDALILCDGIIFQIYMDGSLICYREVMKNDGNTDFWDFYLQIDATHILWYNAPRGGNLVNTDHLKYIDIESKETKDVYLSNGSGVLSACVINQNVYIVSCDYTGNIVLYVYDHAMNLQSQKILADHIPVNRPGANLAVDVHNNLIMVCFEGLVQEKQHGHSGFSTTWIMLFDLSGNLQYYYQGVTGSPAASSTPVWIDDSTLFMGSGEGYSFIQLENNVHVHHYRNDVIMATCEEAGINHYYCSCGEAYDEIIPALGHVWDAWKLLTPAEEDQTGVLSRECKRCGKNEMLAYSRSEGVTIPFDRSEPTFTLPGSIKCIEESAFEGLAMTVVEIPNGCERIGKWAFKDCTQLTQIRIPPSVTMIDDTAFEGCSIVFVFGLSTSPAKAFCNLHSNCIFVADAANE